jgi:hypothetical protein
MLYYIRLIDEGKRKNECEFALGFLAALKDKADNHLRQPIVRTYGTAGQAPGRKWKKRQTESRSAAGPKR